MKILVYDIAASIGGAVGILRDYHRRALLDEGNEYLFVLSSDLLEESGNVKVLCFPCVKKSWIHRVAFDIFKMPRLVKKYNPDRIVSLQNTKVPLTKTEQWVYLHNALPRWVCDTRFSFWGEPLLWTYQNIIGRVIARSVRRADRVIVQSEWMKERCCRELSLSPDLFVVERPKLNASGDIEAKRRPRDGSVRFLYPASAASYKNHEVIVEACSMLEQRGIRQYVVQLTLSGEETRAIAALKARSEKEGLPLVFVGNLSSREMNQAYADSDVLLFPSVVESFGLPLLEAQKYMLSIVAADLSYAHETIGSYLNVKYFNPKSGKQLAEIMEEVMLLAGPQNRV